MDVNRLFEQLKKDEDFTPVARWDVKQWSYGYGCRAPGKGARITEPDAARLLKVRMEEAIDDFERMFAGHEQKFNDVRAEAFVNLIFNMGPGLPDGSKGGLYSFKNTLKLIFENGDVPWEEVAKELKDSLWFKQVGDSGDPPGRGRRIVAEITAGKKVQ